MDTAARFVARMRRVTEEAGSLELGAVVVPPSPDLAYLTGYDPMPLERPTLLVLRTGRTPVMIVPELERPLAAASPAAASIELTGWVDGVDPYEEAARLLPAGAHVAVGDRLWSSHLLGLQGAAPGARFEPGSPVIGRVRAVKDDEELDALRRAAHGADEAFREVCSMRFMGRTEAEIAGELAELLVRN
ncbi:MAG TPA: aminopeptidase P family N-terminal domain-containing protein, partial [Actinomycetota bacterium]|nr:aminopeptidase P family N-terminal domain-containing protein [Actinomycetota bacterium]